jgi:hypothetical protein
VGSTPASSTNLNEETNVPGILLPPAVVAKTSVVTSIPIAQISITLLAGYMGGMAAVITNLVAATASITTLQAALTPAGAVSPPAKVGVNTCIAAVTQITTINASIISAGVQSVAALGLPSPTFPVAGQLVVTQLTALDTFITTFMVVPLSV